MEIFLTQRVTTLSAMKAQLLQQSLISAMTGVAKVGAKYTHDVFTADGAFYVEKSFGLFETKVLPGFKATVSSDKLVEKAVLTATLLINQNAVVDAYDATRFLMTSQQTVLSTAEQLMPEMLLFSHARLHSNSELTTNNSRRFFGTACFLFIST